MHATRVTMPLPEPCPPPSTPSFPPPLALLAMPSRCLLARATFLHARQHARSTPRHRLHLTVNLEPTVTPTLHAYPPCLLDKCAIPMPANSMNAPGPLRGRSSQADAFLLFFSLDQSASGDGEGGSAGLISGEHPTTERARDVAARVPAGRRGASGTPGITLIPVQREDGARSVSFRAHGLMAGHAYTCWVSAHYSYEGWSEWSHAHAFVAAPPRQPPPKPQPPASVRAVDCMTMELRLPSPIGHVARSSASEEGEREPAGRSEAGDVSGLSSGSDGEGSADAASQQPACGAADRYDVQILSVGASTEGDGATRWHGATVVGRPLPGTDLLISGLHPLAAYQLRVIGKNAVHAGMPSDPTAPFLAGIDSSQLLAPPVVVATSSASFELAVAAKQSADDCAAPTDGVAPLRWETSYARVNADGELGPWRVCEHVHELHEGSGVLQVRMPSFPAVTACM